MVFVGAVGSGKTSQAVRIFNAQDEDGGHPFRPALSISCEGASRVTGSSMITSEHCAHYEAGTPEEVTHILETVLPAGHNGKPFALVFFDGWSVLQERTKMDAQRIYLEEENDTYANDQRQLTNRAAARMRPTIAAWQNASQLPQMQGAIFISTCHIEEEWKQKPGTKDFNDRYRVGYKMDIAPSVYRALHRDTGSIVYFLSVLPRVGELGDEEDETEASELQQLDQLAREGNPLASSRFYAFTRPVNYDGDALRFIKHQDGLFSDEALAVWRSPDFGRALLNSPLRK